MSHERYRSATISAYINSLLLLGGLSLVSVIIVVIVGVCHRSGDMSREVALSFVAGPRSIDTYAKPSFL
jgi:hypothetical protein